MRFAIVLVALAAAVSAEFTSYEGHKVYQVLPKTLEQVEMVKMFEKNEKQFDFWTTMRAVNKPVDVMVEPHAQHTFTTFLDRNNIQYKLLINNVETAFGAERSRQAKTPKLPQGKISFTQYHRYGVIQDYLNEIAATYPDVASVSTIGQTYEGRDLNLLKISTGGTGKPAIMIDAGIHAREWIAPATALYIIQELVENPDNRALIENIDWHIVPVLNPDGYEYSHTNTRLWRKTRSPGAFCIGVDPNRNFDFHWMETGASDFECDEIYAGPSAFSESETSALRDYINANAADLKLYLTFHSYGQYLLYPWGYTSALPSDAGELQSLGESVDDAIASLFGTRYEIGSSTNVLYAAAGGSDDWAKGVGGIQLSYTIELPGGGSAGFDLPPSRITPVVQETWLGVKVYHDYILNKFGRK